MKKQIKLGRNLILSAISASVILTGCGNGRTPAVTDAGTGGQPAAAQPDLTSPAGTNFGDVGGYDNTLPQPLPADQAPQQPLDTPEPLPAPSNPVQPGEPMVLRAVSNTTAFAVPRFSKWFQVNGLYVHVNLTWQPVNGAAEYWVFKGRIPQFQEARRELAHAIVPAGFAGSGYKDGIEPPNLKTGNILDRLKRVVNMVANRPGVTYDFKVIAADANGIPMSESPVVQTVPLPGISSATLDAVENNGVSSTRTPLFTWKDAAQGVRPDGYYVSIFPSVQFTQETLPPTSLAYWTTFRPVGSNLARYGEDSANLTSYQGTRPFDITFDLGAAKNYSWSVIGVKTDTGDMRTANAISRSWSGFGHFQIAANAPAAPVRQVASQSYGAYNAPRAQQQTAAPYGQTSYPQQQQQQAPRYPQTQQPQQPQTQAPRF